MSIAEKKTVLVTGGALRIGRAISLDMAKFGWQVAVHFNDSYSEANGVVKAITELGGYAVAIHADLEDEVAVSALIPEIAAKLSPVVALINNASVFEEDSIETATALSWQRHHKINLQAPFLLTQSLVKNLPKNNKANIINIVFN